MTLTRTGFNMTGTPWSEFTQNTAHWTAERRRCCNETDGAPACRCMKGTYELHGAVQSHPPQLDCTERTAGRKAPLALLVAQLSRVQRTPYGSGPLVQRSTVWEYRLSLSDPTCKQSVGHQRLLAMLGALSILLSTGCSQCSHPSKTKEQSDSRTTPGNSASLIGGPLGEILSFNSPDCVTCARSHCLPKIDRCMKIEGNATGGPAKGKSKSELCINTVACAIKGRCLTEHASVFCYCGSTNGGDCITGHEQNGSCKSKIEAAFETTASQKIVVNWNNDTTGGGVAMTLATCLIENSCTMCF